MSLLIPVADHVDDDGTGEDEDGVCVVGDLDAVAVAQGKPFLGDFRDLLDPQLMV